MYGNWASRRLCAISQLCSLTDVKCMDTCTNPELEAKIAPCVEQKCTVRESLTTQRISDLKCGRPIRDRTKVVSIAGVVGGGVAFLAFILRMMARLPFFNGGPFGMDDVMIIVAMIYYWDEWIYFSAIVPTKMSLHFFYLRIFPKKSFRIAIYIVMGITLAYGIVFILVSVFQCSPIKTAWLRWDGTAPGHCNNINLQGWTSAAINIVLDFVTLALPLRELSQMDLWRKKKIHICIMFSVGSLLTRKPDSVTIVSILRLQSLLKFAKSRNFTWDYVEMGYWSTIEVHVGIICACMPAIRSLLRRLFPSFFSYTQHQKSGTFGNSSSHDESVMRNSQPPKSDFHESDSLPLVDVYNSRPQYSYFHAK
ncbi:CFEM domain-containing protein [Histoplasma capsulatum G186AR]|uniref:CFEM domain-containing protein n=1 Tax=Ajellomyces capsulatus (strain G186AR / H82 / ATCC MYA-2454 / RMSCC 2432) TaxID=447093 RepID=C0NG07_AJECG|nr:CFEM domain-containing protein [Histoplasma capsulatum G186AR]EEH10178.1 CFEM domain-containing protein [Histoplasma capsulatum G186AR]